MALRLERAPEMIRELLRGEGQKAVHIKLDGYHFEMNIDNQDFWCEYE